MFFSPSILVWVTVCSSFAQAKYHFDFSKATKDASTVVAQTVDLPLDHFGNSNATISNRYWVNDEFYRHGGPVFIFDSGEGDASGSIPYLFLGQGADSFADYGQRFNGLLILWEHRYYGQSYPSGNVSTITNPDDLYDYYKYLTFEQAMEDVVVFAKNFSMASRPGQDLRPNSVPWVFVGGSYPGVRAAYLRLRNPEVIYASLSSSAPVQLQEYFWQYYIAAERKLKNTPGYLGCLNDAHAIVNYVNDIYTKQDLQAVESFLSTANLNWNTSTDTSAAAWDQRRQALGSVTDTVLGDFQGQGLAGGLGDFCAGLNDPKYTNDTGASTTDFKGGIVPFFGLNKSVEIYTNVIHDLQAAKVTFVNNNTIARHSKAPDSSADSLSWSFQTCIEAGYFQVSNPSRPTNLVPAFSTVDTYIQDTCTSVYGNRTASGPDVTKLLSKYNGWHMSTSNVFHVNGEYDPWRALSVGSDVNATNPGLTLTTKIPAPNTPLPNGTVFGYVIKEGYHCSDLGFNLTAAQTNTTIPGTPDADAYVAHEVFASALSSWLPAYTKFAATPTTTINTMTATSTSTATATASGKNSASQASIWGSAWALTGMALLTTIMA